MNFRNHVRTIYMAVFTAECSLLLHFKQFSSSFIQAWDWHSIMEFATQPDIVRLYAEAIYCSGVRVL